MEKEKQVNWEKTESIICKKHSFILSSWNNKEETWVCESCGKLMEYIKTNTLGYLTPKEGSIVNDELLRGELNEKELLRFHKGDEPKIGQ